MDAISGFFIEWTITILPLCTAKKLVYLNSRWSDYAKKQCDNRESAEVTVFFDERKVVSKKMNILSGRASRLRPDRSDDYEQFVAFVELTITNSEKRSKGTKHSLPDILRLISLDASIDFEHPKLVLSEITSPECFHALKGSFPRITISECRQVGPSIDEFLRKVAKSGTCLHVTIKQSDLTAETSFIILELILQKQFSSAYVSGCDGEEFTPSQMQSIIDEWVRNPEQFEGKRLTISHKGNKELWRRDYGFGGNHVGLHHHPEHPEHILQIMHHAGDFWIAFVKQ
ncbi:hypothetical protein QR680_014074 [Steinernema hermaphroditum]|uniref:Uncharacterized protein n=1 Tax=Steinernema hermaphroditum TaxID=289476 RepID=A0AA39M2L1_9BILA|nr:hypothetical protein QR680_014074 [Steinernema hermaphroditum]